MTEQDRLQRRPLGLGGVDQTCTLYLRSYESCSQLIVLGDRGAADAVDRIDYDFAHSSTRRRSRCGRNGRFIDC